MKVTERFAAVDVPCVNSLTKSSLGFTDICVIAWCYCHLVDDCLFLQVPTGNMHFPLHLVPLHECFS